MGPVSQKLVPCGTDGQVLLSGFQALVTLTLDRVIRHTVMHDSSSSIYVSNFIENGKPYLGLDGCTYIPTDGHFRPPLMLLGRLGGADLKMLSLSVRFVCSTTLLLLSVNGAKTRIC